MRGSIFHKFQIRKYHLQIYVVHIFQTTSYNLSDIYVIFNKKEEKRSGIYVIDREFTGIAIFGFKHATTIWKLDSLILTVN